MSVSPFPLLRLLADGEFHSGRDLGAALALSRGAIWHRVRLAEATGLRIFKVRGRGYRLARPLDLLQRDVLASRAARLAPPLSIEVLDECASTSSVLLERIDAGAPCGSAVVCEHQSAGRGP
jgi:BirA family biotin operon repressor/biotin-[acetyl-CoA-carboxylase] ligase